MNKVRQCPRCGNLENPPPMAEQSRRMARRAERILNGRSGTPQAEALSVYIRAQHDAASALDAASFAWDAYLHALSPKDFPSASPGNEGGGPSSGKGDDNG